jgi:antitoxin component of MazEF toxin-antitoxin module
MAHITKIGNSLFALVPAHAARQLSLSNRTKIRVFVDETCIRISHANPPRTDRSSRAKATAVEAIETDDPW